MNEHDPSATATTPDIAALIASGQAAGRWVLDPAASSAEFQVKHFWGAVTVHGTFGQITGEGTVGTDGTISGLLTIDASSLDTKNKQRDKHLRSADFFDTEHHPNLAVTVTDATPAGPDALACHGDMDAAGHVRPIQFTARLTDVSAQAAILHTEIEVDRTQFGMTWSPLKMAAPIARAIVTARFVRA